MKSVDDKLAAHVQHEQRIGYGREITLEEARALAADRLAQRGEDGTDWRARYRARKQSEEQQWQDRARIRRKDRR